MNYAVANSSQFPWQIEVIAGLLVFFVSLAFITPYIAPFIAKRVEKRRQRGDGDLNFQFRWDD